MKIITNTDTVLNTILIPRRGDTVRSAYDMIAWVCHKMAIDGFTLNQTRINKDFVEFTYHQGTSSRESLEKTVTSLAEDFRALRKEGEPFENQVKVYWVTKGVIPKHRVQAFMKELQDLPHEQTQFSITFPGAPDVRVEGRVEQLTLTRGALGWNPVQLPGPPVPEKTCTGIAKVFAYKQINPRTVDPLHSFILHRIRENIAERGLVLHSGMDLMLTCGDGTSCTLRVGEFPAGQIPAGWYPLREQDETPEDFASKGFTKAPDLQNPMPTDKCVKHGKVFPIERECPDCHSMSTQRKEGTDRRRGLEPDPNSSFERKLRALTDEMHKSIIPMVGRVKIEGCGVPGSQIMGYKCRRHGDLGETYHCDACMRMSYCEKHNEVYPSGVSCCVQCGKSTPF